MSAELKAIEVKSIAAAAAVEATADGAAFDLLSYDGDIQVILDSAAGAGTLPTLDVKIQHSDVTTANTFVDAGVAFTQVTAAAASFQVKHLRADNFKRYIRIAETVAGTDPVFTRAVTFVGKRRA